MSTQQDIMGEILSADDMELGEGTEKLDHLIYQDALHSYQAPEEEPIEPMEIRSREDLSVVVLEHESKIKIRFSLQNPGRGLELNKVADVAAQAILTHLEQEVNR
ncbi:MAG: hypothetical protein MI747_09040 [Desulfobacterales bacterium]|nr:hypothetical protein [Desulfobacterales bacterium]